MARRSTIGENPLDTLIPPTPLQPATKKPESGKKSPATETTASPSKEDGARTRERVTVHISMETLERIRNAVYWSPGMTLAEFTEEALQRYLAVLEEARGEAFPARAGELKRGRPIR